MNLFKTLRYNNAWLIHRNEWEWNENGIIMELGDLCWRFVYRIRSATSAVLQQNVGRYVINTYSADTLLVLMTGAASWAVTVAEFTLRVNTGTWAPANGVESGDRTVTLRVTAPQVPKTRAKKNKRK